MATANPSQPLIVVVSGGGPVGLTFSLHLTMMMGKNVKIIIYEGRWFVNKEGKTQWQNEEQGKTRRDQVVTLQDHVIQQMPEYIQKGLFQKFDERVWPTSRNIPIREVEDRLFDLLQPFVQNGQIELVTENLHEQSECLIKGNFDILVGTDGSNSFVRRYCNIQMVSEGVEYACGVAYNIPNQVASTDEPLHQALNCILTVSQTRYLVNSSTSRRGYLNIRLIQNEYDELRDRLQIFQTRNEPLDLLDFDKCPHSPVWTIIRQGLEFFRIPSKYVFRVLPIEISVRHASIVVRELRFEINKSDQPTNKSHSKRYKTALAFLAGDAAMNVHFWPGRGMNSGMKGAMALARNILRSCTSNNSINIRTPLRFLDFLDYEGFMARLRAREQQGRSLRVLVDPIDKSIAGAFSYAHLPHCYDRYKRKLIEKLKETRQRLQERPEWPHKSRLVTDEELQSASNRIAHHAVAQLSLANPWPTREMGGIEVLVEDIFPYDLKTFLPVPTTTLTTVDRPPTVIIRYHFLILWITGNEKVESIDNLVREIQKSPKFIKSPSNTISTHRIVVVQTTEQAKEWIESNRALVQRTDIIFKVVTQWTIKDDQTAVDVIRAVRSELPQVPVLVFTNKHEEKQLALEFHNVMTTDTEFEVKEFVGINQETQWNAGCEVSHRQNPALNKDDQQQRKSAVAKSEPSKSVEHSTLPYPLLDSPVASNGTSLPPVPNFFYPPLPSPTTPKSSNLKPMILWIDSSENVGKTADEIRKIHPTLEILFIPIYKDAELYLQQQLREIQDREKFIAISRGYYVDELKSFVDVEKLLDGLDLGTKPLGVYTRNRASLLEKTPNTSEKAEVFDKNKDLIAFVNRHLNR